MSTTPERAPVETFPDEDSGTTPTGTADYPISPLADEGRSRAAAPTQPPPRSRGINWRALSIELLVPFLAIFTALVIGAIIIFATGASVTKAYSGLFVGALGTPTAIAN